MITNSLKIFKKGLQTTELTLFSSLFQNYSNALYWKIDFEVNNQASIGMASIILKKNLLPLGGSCSVDINQGISLLTYFTITCQNWIDLDGQIATYEYMGMFDKKNANEFNNLE